MPEALDGITVADFSQMMQGPWATQKLADMGADVIKIEPLDGELEREMDVGGEMLGGESPWYLAMNRNKRSVSVDLKEEKGIGLVKNILREADLLVENFRPGVMERLGLGYENVREINEQIVYVSASGYGEDGPYRDRPGQDLLSQALSGLMTKTGRRDNPPTTAGTFVADELSASMIALHAMIGLFYRERTGIGQRIEANLMSSLIDAMTQEVTSTLNLERDFERPNENIAHAYFDAPYGIYETANGHVAISVGQLEKIADALDIPELYNHDTPAKRFENRDEIFRLIEERTKEYETSDVLEILLNVDVWASQVHTIQEMCDDPQVHHNNMIIEIDHPKAGTYKTTGVPVEMTETPGRIESPPPQTGEHTLDVLVDLDYDDDQIENLIESDIVNTAESS